MDTNKEIQMLKMGIVELHEEVELLRDLVHKLPCVARISNQIDALTEVFGVDIATDDMVNLLKILNGQEVNAEYNKRKG